jgi:hypothetical protein
VNHPVSPVKLSASAALKKAVQYENITLYINGILIIMKKIINIIVIMLLVTVTANHASAQSKMTEEQKKEAKEKYQAYKDKLNLNEDQSKKVDAINTTWFEGIAELKNSGASKMSKYRKFKSLNSERDKKMKEVLTKDQFRIYQQQQKEMKDEFKERRANRE